MASISSTSNPSNFPVSLFCISKGGNVGSVATLKVAPEAWDSTGMMLKVIAKSNPTKTRANRFNLNIS